jgi:hypothetical protein
MKSTTNALVSAAVAGLLLATGCSKEEAAKPGTPAPKAAKSGATPAALAVAEKHACKGHNACKNQGGCQSGDNGCAAKNSCKGNGGCATVEHHGCAGKNACKNQGGCKSGDNGCAAKNSCAGKGGCGVPIKH